MKQLSRYAMQNLRYLCWLFLVGLLPMFTASPVPSSLITDSSHTQTSWQWEHYWIRYALTLSSVTATALTLAGCLCCQKQRRPKGFQDKAEKCNQEFKDGSSIEQESTLDRSVERLELDASKTLAASERIQFEPLPVDCIISGTRNALKPKSIPLSAPYIEDTDMEDADCSILQESYSEWFKLSELNVPREKLKYFREIGHGWFGKVVEGRADLEQFKGISKSGGVVVRILTEEATIKEKAWFLSEATPYLKLRHQNILALLGFCLETDPYLLLFESCPNGDLKGFLLSNRDAKSRGVLVKENVPICIATEIAAGLKHMHSHGFVHTDLSARNCLVAPDLSAKLGDYGTGVEKYPEDYYIIGGRALPIRWSAPESLNCTDTTIETRKITFQANMWSYAVLLWEIVTWGERPYNDMNDEQVIQMILSLKNEFSPNGTRLWQNHATNCPPNIFQITRSCLNVQAKDRPSLDDVRQVLLNEQSTYLDFEQRWESLRTNSCSKQHVRNASLQNLRSSIDSDYWTHIVDEAPMDMLQSSFHLGPEEQVKNMPTMKNITVFHESGSETEEESWKGRIEKGVYTEKVKQKSKSVTDLMVLVHIDPDSDAEWSMGVQMPEKNANKKLNVTCSESDLRHTVSADEFDDALKKLRDFLPLNTTVGKVRSLENLEQPKLLTLTMDQSHTPILRLSLDSSEKTPENNDNDVPSATTAIVDSTRIEKHVLRLLSKEDLDLPLLRYVPDQISSIENTEEEKDCDKSSVKEDSNDAKSPEYFLSTNVEANKQNVDVLLWNYALDSALEQKMPGLSDIEVEFNEYIDPSVKQDNTGTPELGINVTSTPNVKRSCNASSPIYNADDNFCITEDEKVERKSQLPNDDEEERKQLSTPDDEQSSDSGFRDKESCEEEELVCLTSGNHLLSTDNIATISESLYPEEEPFQILFELDTILDAAYNTAPPTDSESITENIVLTPGIENTSSSQQINAISEVNCISLNSTELGKKINFTASNPTQTVDTKENLNRIREHDNTIESNDVTTEKEEDIISEKTQEFKVDSIDRSSTEEKTITKFNASTTNSQQDSEQCSQGDYENEDEDSSTVSLRSDNSYVSFGIEEEFVIAIRNELREKLPQAQMQIVESLESHDDENFTISGDIYSKQWDDEDSEDPSNHIGGGVDISIRYNVYGTPLSPILEERESIITSESLISNSREVSIASRESVPSEDVLLADAHTNQILLERLREQLQDEDRDTTNGDLSDEENLDYNSVTYPLENKLCIVKTSGGAPLPSPEEESKWQQLPSSFPLPLPIQNNLMSTSFTEHECCNDEDEEEEEEEEGEEEEEEEEEEEDGEGEEEDEDNSSSSGEFVWKTYNKPHIEQIEIRSTANDDEMNTTMNELEEKLGVEDEDEEEEFTPSAWNAALAPHRSALRSPDKTLKSGDQKKSVWFKKQRYHCVYEYPKETLPIDNRANTTINSEPTSYTDWEGMINEPRLDLYSLDYDDTNHTGSEEFFVTSSNRPFQFENKYASQFFPGENATILPDDQDVTDGYQQELPRQNNVDCTNEYEQCQQQQLGELRHTRDRLKLNLISSNDTPSASFIPVTQPHLDSEQESVEENHESMDLVQDQCISVSSPLNDNALPKVPRENL